MLGWVFFLWFSFLCFVVASFKTCLTLAVGSNYRDVTLAVRVMLTFFGVERSELPGMCWFGWERGQWRTAIGASPADSRR